MRDGGKKHFTHCMDSLFAKTPTYLRRKQVFMQHVWERQLHRFRLHWQDKRKGWVVGGWGGWGLSGGGRVVVRWGW